MSLSKQEADLQGLRTEGRKLQAILATVTSDYDVYLKKYNDVSERISANLKSAQEASKVNVARASSEIAVVLVLIDATSHQFLDDLYRSTHSGGADTAKRLRAVVGERVAAMFPVVARGGYTIVIKIFGCLKTLSSRLAARNLAPSGHRSLAYHFAELTKVSPFFDFVDTGDRCIVPTKICENFKFYMAIEQCKHVFFAAADSSKYYAALEPYRGQTKRVTIVTGSIADQKIRAFGLHVVSFQRVFKASALSSGSTTNVTKSASSEASVGQVTPGVPSTPAVSVPAASLVNVNSVTQEVVTPPRVLPLPMRYRHGRVPVNLAKQRLDLQSLLPTPAELQAYKERTKLQDLCMDIHLRGHCIAKECKLSHGASLVPEVYCVLQYRALGMPCSKGDGCRDSSCVNAHVCQKEECTLAGGKAALCGLTDAMHKVDLHVAEWVVADDGAVQSSIPVQDNVVSVAGAQVNSHVPPSFMEDLISF